MDGGLGRALTLVLGAVLIASVIPGQAQAGQPDDHVQLDGAFDHGYGDGGRTIVSVDAVGGTWTAEVTSKDFEWLVYTTFFPQGLVFHLQGSWEDGFDGKSVGVDLCDWRIHIEPYGEGEEIRVFVYGAAPISSCWYWWWGDFSDAELV